MREILKEGASIYLEAGETFDAHFTGRSGTGYSWVNSHQFETNEEQRVVYTDQYTVHNDDFADGWAAADEEFGEAIGGLRPTRRHGTEVSIF